TPAVGDQGASSLSPVPTPASPARGAHLHPRDPRATRGRRLGRGAERVPAAGRRRALGVLHVAQRARLRGSPSLPPALRGSRSRSRRRGGQPARVAGVTGRARAAPPVRPVEPP